MGQIIQLQHTSIPMAPGGEAATRRLFGETLGMREVKPPTALAALNLVWFQPGQGGQEIHVFEDAGMTHNSSGQHICLQVDDLEWCRERLTTAGYEVEETIPIQHRPRFFVRDAFGNLIEMTQVTGDYS